MSHPSLRLRASVLTAAWLLLAPAAPASAEIFLKLGDIKGEATGQGFEGMLEVSSFNLGVSRTFDPASKSSFQISLPQFSGLVISREHDAASQAIWELALANRPVGALLFVTDSQMQIRKVILLERAFVASYQVSGGETEPPQESFELFFQNIRFAPTLKDKGTGWDLIGGKAY